MFTGIVEEVGTLLDAVDSSGSRIFRISSTKCLRELHVGDSISVDGVCLTVIEHDSSSFQVEAVEETLKKTSLGRWRAGNRVNLELPLRFNDRLGGHLVLGHVDTVGRVERVETRDDSWMFYISFPDKFTKYVIPVGSIAVNGVSLTVAERQSDMVGVSIIPHTWANTTFQYLSMNDAVNIEFDLLGKYAVSLLEGSGFLKHSLD